MRASDRVHDVMLCDVRMPGLDGLALLRSVRAEAPEVDVVLMTAFDDMPTVATAMREGAADFLVKPLDLHELRRLRRPVLTNRQLRVAAGASTSRPPKWQTSSSVLPSLCERQAASLGIRGRRLDRGGRSRGQPRARR